MVTAPSRASRICGGGGYPRCMESVGCFGGPLNGLFLKMGTHRGVITVGNEQAEAGHYEYSTVSRSYIWHADIETEQVHIRPKVRSVTTREGVL